MQRFLRNLGFFGRTDGRMDGRRTPAPWQLCWQSQAKLKIQKFFFLKKTQKTSGHIAQVKQEPKFERNPCNRFRNNWCHRRTMDNGQTTDDRRILISWALLTQSSRAKNPQFFLSKKKKTSGHMAQGKPQLKFDRNWCNNFRDNPCHRWTTNGRRTDRQKSHTISSADRVKQLKILYPWLFPMTDMHIFLHVFWTWVLIFFST